MAEKIASLYAEITADTTKLQKGLGDGKKELGGFSSKLNSTVKELTGFSISQISAAGAVAALVGGVKKAIGDYSSYVEQVDKISMATGMASEETSRLIQVADDFRVDVGALSGALRMALQNGFNPTTEALANLSDRVMKIQDPTKRAAELQKIFGRSWQEMIPFLERGGDAIRAASDGISDGLVVTQSAIETNRKYQESVDNLGDAWTAFKFSLVGDILPAIAEALDKQSTAIDTYGKGYSRALVEGMARAAEATKAWNSDTREAAFAAKYATTANEDYADSDHEIAMALQFMGEAAKKAARDLEASTKKMDEQAEAQRNIMDATLDLREAQQGWLDGTGNDVQAALEAAGVKGDAYDKALSAIDQTYGTGLAVQNEYKKDLAAMTAEYAKDKDVDKFKKAVGELKNTYMETDKSIQAATDSLWRFKLMWDTLQSKSLLLDVSIPGSPSASAGDNGLGGDTVIVPDTDPGRGGGNNRFAIGGPANAGDILWTGERGPEPFIPSQDGRILNNQDAMAVLSGAYGGGGLNINGPITIIANDPASFIRQLQAMGKSSRLASVGGSKYQGV
jgi:hypothetical protein